MSVGVVHVEPVGIDKFSDKVNFLIVASVVTFKAFVSNEVVLNEDAYSSKALLNNPISYLVLSISFRALVPESLVDITAIPWEFIYTLYIRPSM